MNDFLISCIYEYLDRVASQAENQYKTLVRKTDLKKADSVDIIDLIEARIKYETLCDVENHICELLAWGQRFYKSN